MTTPFFVSPAPITRTHRRRRSAVTNGTVRSYGVPVFERFAHGLLDLGARLAGEEAQRVRERGRRRGVELSDAIGLVRPDGRHRGEVELPAADAGHGGHGVEQMPAPTHLGFGSFTAQERRLERSLRVLTRAGFLLRQALVALRAPARMNSAMLMTASSASRAHAGVDERQIQAADPCGLGSRVTTQAASKRVHGESGQNR